MKYPKILLIGNMANNSFALARYLRDEGYEVKILLMKNEPEHYHPKNDSFSDDYKSYTRVVPWTTLPSDLISITKEEIIKEVDGYDILIGLGPAPAYLNKINRSLDIFIPYGGDLYDQPFINIHKLKRVKKLLKQYYYSRNQKKGIERAGYIVYEYTNDGYEKIFNKFKLKGKRLKFTIPFLYYPEYSNIDANTIDSVYAKEYKAIREHYDYVVFHHCAHSWHPDTMKTKYSKYVGKGNDKVIIGFQEFLHETGANACLVMLEYYTDVNNSKKLVEKLGIQKNVAWFPVMPRKEIMVGLSLADVGVAEIAHPWITYGTVYEMIISGKPVIMNRSDKIYELYPEQYPIQNATNADEVCAGLKYYYSNRQKAREDGVAAREWFIKYIAKENLKKICDLIDEIAVSKQPG